MLHFSKPIILILLLCFIVGYKYLFIDQCNIRFLVGIVILFSSISYFETQIRHSNGHGSVIIYIFNFIFHTIHNFNNLSILEEI